MIPDLTPDQLTTLARYFAGQCSAAESARIAEWIAAEPGRQARVEALRAEWAASGFLLDAPRVEALWQRLERRRSAIDDTAARRAAALRRAATRWRPAPTWRAAAAAALVVGAAAGFWWVAGERLAERAGWLASAPAAQTQTYATPRGQRASLRLPDGSQVMLGPASTIRYAVAAARGPRTVTLEGEAYFVVTHDEARPFTVHTAHGIAKDLGTRFTVRAYPADSAVDVVVAEGKVAITAARAPAERVPAAAADAAAPAPTEQVPAADSLLLTPGDRGRVTSGGRMTVEHGVPVDRYLAWTEGRLEFQDTPLRDAIVQIGHWYDLDIRLASPALGRKQLTASFKDEPASEVLRLLAASAGVRVEQHGSRVTLRAK